MKDVLDRERSKVLNGVARLFRRHQKRKAQIVTSSRSRATPPSPNGVNHLSSASLATLDTSAGGVKGVHGMSPSPLDRMDSTASLGTCDGMYMILFYAGSNTLMVYDLVDKRGLPVYLHISTDSRGYDVSPTL